MFLMFFIYKKKPPTESYNSFSFGVEKTKIHCFLLYKIQCHYHLNKQNIFSIGICNPFVFKRLHDKRVV